MNLWGKRALLPLLAASFFVACEDPGEIGIQESIPNPFEVTFIDIPLDPQTVYIDSINSTNTSSLLFGSYNDPTFGEINAVPHMEFQIPQLGFGVPQNAVFDSILLLLDDNYGYGPDVDLPITLDVFRFEGTMESRLYFTKDSLETRLALGFDRALLGSHSFDYNPESESPTKIKLKDTFGEQLLLDAIENADSTFNLQDRFKEYLSGVKITTRGSNGAVFGFDPLGDSTMLIIYYHYEDIGFSFNEELEFFLQRGFTNINVDFAGTQFENASQSFEEVATSSNMAYQNPTLGLFIKLGLKNFYNFKDTAENIIINRADIIFDLDESQLALDPPFEIRLHQLDDYNDFILSDYSFVPRSIHTEGPEVLFQPTISDKPLDFIYDSLNYRYSEQVTFYIKNLMSEKLSDSTLLVTPPLGPLRDASLTDSTYFPRVNSVNQFIVPKDQVKLRIYYSKFDK